MSSRLIVSISGIRDSYVNQVVALGEEIAKRNTPVSYIAAPRRGRNYRLVDDKGTQEWLRARRCAGDAIVLGGYDESATKPRRAEFAAIGAAEAKVRLTAADRLMADMGLRTRLFAPPQWNVSPGCLSALPKVGFQICAELSGIHDVTLGTTERGRVLSLGEGFIADAWWCRAVVAAAGRTARVGGLVRINVNAKHLQRLVPASAVLDAMDAAIDVGAVPSRYEWRQDSTRQTAA